MVIGNYENFRQEFVKARAARAKLEDDHELHTGVAAIDKVDQAVKVAYVEALEEEARTAKAWATAVRHRYFPVT